MTRLLSSFVALSAFGMTILGVLAVPATAHDEDHRNVHHRTTLTERFCAHEVNEPAPDPQLVQSLRRDDLVRVSVIDVSVVSARELHDPFILSCAFTDTNGNGAQENGERINVRVLRKRGTDIGRIDYRRQIATDPSTSVCVLSIVLDGAPTHRLLRSAATCIVNPPTDVPEAPMVALLGLSGLGTMAVVGWRRRRSLAA